MDVSSKTSVFVAGGTGLIGSSLIEGLTSNPNVQITQIGRRSFGQPEAVSDIIVDDLLALKLSEHSINSDQPNTSSVGFICLGTTKKQAGSNQALWEVDHDMVVHIASEMKKAGVEHIGVVSSYGASPSSLSHYLRCKGKMEHDVAALKFKSVVFARPGPLVGDREVPRVDEKWVQAVLKVVNPIMRGPLENLKPIEAEKVAASLFQAVMKNGVDETKLSEPRFLFYRDMAFSDTTFIDKAR